MSGSHGPLVPWTRDCEVRRGIGVKSTRLGSSLLCPQCLQVLPEPELCLEPESLHVPSEVPLHCPGGGFVKL